MPQSEPSLPQRLSVTVLCLPVGKSVSLTDFEAFREFVGTFLKMARARKPNPMEKAHIHRLEENWHLVEDFLDEDDILSILCDRGVLERDDVMLIERDSAKQGFEYLFQVLTEYGGADGLYIFVEALKSKDKKYATIIAELSEGFNDGETQEELELKNLKILQLEGKLEEEINKNKTLERKLEKLKQESASKDIEINRLKTELSNVTMANEGLKSRQASRNGKHPTNKPILFKKREQLDPKRRTSERNNKYPQ